ncbi:hypothetical protein NDU88_008843 [Pleurodeles waltl]|uniref:Uncharacterized protein n=1 Tax=Pleurodeles waltl TaxID=8319 RepID=A0AAV7RYU6_PLEWA|nr:hypothetical protein NDU88_008843 [Pleurodeles waltl]
MYRVKLHALVQTHVCEEKLHALVQTLWTALCPEQCDIKIKNKVAHMKSDETLVPRRLLVCPAKFHG